MSQDEQLTLQGWYAAQQAWPDVPDAPVRCELFPQQVQAAGPCVLEATFTAEAHLRPGARIYFELPHGWGKHMGRCYGSRGVAPRSEMVPGMGLIIDAFGPDEEPWDDYVEALDLDRFWVIVTQTPESGLPAGEQCRLVLGVPPGSPVQAQKWAQEAVFTSGVDMGDGVILPVDPQPSITVGGGPAARLRVFAPATPPSEEFIDVAVVAKDAAYENGAYGYSAEVFVFEDGQIVAPDTVEVRTGYGEAECEASPGQEVLGYDLFIDRSEFAGPGWLRVLDPDSDLAGRSDPIWPDFLPDEHRIFFGDPHGQVHDSIGAGTHEEYFRWAMHSECLDFCMVANHYGGRARADDDTWRRCVDATNEHNHPGLFATVVTYECGSSDGHRNVYYRGDYGDLFLHGGLTEPGATTMPELVSLLKEHGRDVFIVPHHPNYCSPVDWSAHDSRYQRLVEICSQWGVSEEGPVHSVQAALNMGHRLGFMGGSDTHSGTPGRSGHGSGQPCGLTAVIAPELTREAVWEALHDRRCYAVFGERMLIDFSVAGYGMGREVSVHTDDAEAAERRVVARVATRTPIASLEVIRNGEVIHAWDDAVGERHAEVEFVDGASLGDLLLEPAFEGLPPFCYYYLRVRTAIGNLGWSSPVWFSPDVG